MAPAPSLLKIIVPISTAVDENLLKTYGSGTFDFASIQTIVQQNYENFNGADGNAMRVVVRSINMDDPNDKAPDPLTGQLVHATTARVQQVSYVAVGGNQCGASGVAYTNGYAITTICMDGLEKDIMGPILGEDSGMIQDHILDTSPHAQQVRNLQIAQEIIHESGHAFCAVAQRPFDVTLGTDHFYNSALDVLQLGNIPYTSLYSGADQAVGNVKATYDYDTRKALGLYRSDYLAISAIWPNARIDDSSSPPNLGGWVSPCTKFKYGTADNLQIDVVIEQA